MLMELVFVSELYLGLAESAIKTDLLLLYHLLLSIGILEGPLELLPDAL